MTNKLQPRAAARTEIGAADRQETGRRVNDRAENSHLPLGRRDRAMQRFGRMRYGGLPRFTPRSTQISTWSVTSTHDRISCLAAPFPLPCDAVSARLGPDRFRQTETGLKGDSTDSQTDLSGVPAITVEHPDARAHWRRFPVARRRRIAVLMLLGRLGCPAQKELSIVVGSPSSIPPGTGRMVADEGTAGLWHRRVGTVGRFPPSALARGARPEALRDEGRH